MACHKGTGTRASASLYPPHKTWAAHPAVQHLHLTLCNMRNLFSDGFPDKGCDLTLMGLSIITLISENDKSLGTMTSKVLGFGSRNQLSTVYFKNSHNKPAN